MNGESRYRSRKEEAYRELAKCAFGPLNRLNSSLGPGLSGVAKEEKESALPNAEPIERKTRQIQWHSS